MLEREFRRFGSRFDGTRLRRVEWALYLSPNLCARWLGWLAEKEGLGIEEVARRWRRLADLSQGRLSFVVRLSAYPRESVWDLTEPARPKPDVIQRAAFELEVLGPPVVGEGTRLASLRARGDDALDAFRWWTAVPWADLLAPETHTTDLRPFWGLGDYHATWWWVETPQPPVLAWWPRFALRIDTPRRPRTAFWQR